MQAKFQLDLYKLLGYLRITWFHMFKKKIKRRTTIPSQSNIVKKYSLLTLIYKYNIWWKISIQFFHSESPKHTL